MEIGGFVAPAAAAQGLNARGAWCCARTVTTAKRNSGREANANGGNGREGKPKRRLRKGSDQHCGWTRRTLQAKWAGLVVAESAQYEFMDGRFLFPRESVRWEFIKKGNKTRHHNPVGRLGIHDIVKRDARGRVLARNRGAVMSFQELKRPFDQLEGYTYFWKGVELKVRADGGGERFEEGGNNSAMDDEVEDGRKESVCEY